MQNGTALGVVLNKWRVLFPLLCLVFRFSEVFESFRSAFFQKIFHSSIVTALPVFYDATFLLPFSGSNVSMIFIVLMYLLLFMVVRSPAEVH